MKAHYPHTALLLAGMLAGALLAGYQAAVGSSPLNAGSSSEVMARVDGKPITRTELEAVVEAIATEQPGADRAQLRTSVLHRLIDEELLIQHALDTGIAERDRQVRSALVASVMATRRAEAALKSLDEADLRAFYEANQSRFMPPERLRLRALAVEQPQAMEKLEQLRAQLAESTWQSVIGRPDVHPLPIPDTGLPASALANYIGAELADAASRLSIGESSLVEQADAVILLQLINREQAQPGFEEVRDAVQAALRREHAEQSLQALLESLRTTRDIEVLPGETD